MIKTGNKRSENSNLNSGSTVNTSLNTKVITGKIRLAYANLFIARAMEEGQEAKYSLCVLIPKGDKVTIDKINSAIEVAKISGASILGDITKGDFKTPMRDGDEERADQSEYLGHYFINATSKLKPGIVDKNLKQIVDSTKVYSGCYGRVSLNFYAFNQGGNKGIGCGLQNLQKLAEGEPLSTRATAEEDFEVVDNIDFQESDKEEDILS
jgi:hypothetical protein